MTRTRRVLPVVNLCACGCGTLVARRFVSGHNARGKSITETHRARLSASLTEAWTAKRERMPLGSTRICAKGYRLVKVREGGRWDKEHILVMEKHIGRKLHPGEQVHHINARKLDNRIENLELCATGSEHQLIESTYRRLLPELLDAGHIIYDRTTKEYRVAP